MGALNRRADRESRQLMIMIGWTAKVTKMLQSLLAEVNGPAPENSLIQARVLLETLVNFEYFVTELVKDQASAITRFWDAMALQLGKNFRIIGAHPEGAGLTQEVRDEARRTHAHAAARVGDNADVKAVERHGFYGENIQARCQKMDRGRYYDLLYRPFCDPVHAGDILQCALMVIRPDEAAEIVRNMVPPALAVGIETALRVFTIVDKVYGDPVGEELKAIKAEWQSANG